jgi:hypothetical protein
MALRILRRQSRRELAARDGGGAPVRDGGDRDRNTRRGLRISAGHGELHSGTDTKYQVAGDNGHDRAQHRWKMSSRIRHAEAERPITARDVDSRAAVDDLSVLKK